MCAATGLIIDAFGELRDQQEQVKEDMEVSRTAVIHMYCIKNKTKCEKKRKMQNFVCVKFIYTKSVNSSRM